MKISRKTGRYVALLLGTVLVAAGVAAGGASATALASGCGGGSARPAPACEGPGAGHRSARAEALALLRHRGSQSAVTGIGRSGTPALTPGVPGVVAPGTRSALNGVFCTSASNCWAVGSAALGWGHVVRWVTMTGAARAAGAGAPGERSDGSLFLAADGRRLDRHGAARIVRRAAQRARITKPVGPHPLRPAFITAALGWVPRP